MRKLMVVLGLAALAGCAGVKKEQYAAKEAEAAKYKAAADEATAKATALEAKAKSLEEQNAALQSQVSGFETKFSDLEKKYSGLEKQYSETSAAKSDLEVTTAKLQGESGQYAKMNEELKGRLTIRINDRFLFKEGSAALSTEDKRKLDAIADALTQIKGKHVIVAGYTDDTEGGKNGTVKRWQLSTTRAVEVAKYLVGRGVDAKVIGVAGFGEARPAASNDSRENRGLNRRVEIALAPADHKMGTLEVKPATFKK